MILLPGEFPPAVAVFTGLVFIALALLVNHFAPAHNCALWNYWCIR